MLQKLKKTVCGTKSIDAFKDNREAPNIVFKSLVGLSTGLMLQIHTCILFFQKTEADSSPSERWLRERNKVVDVIDHGLDSGQSVTRDASPSHMTCGFQHPSHTALWLPPTELGGWEEPLLRRCSISQVESETTQAQDPPRLPSQPAFYTQCIQSAWWSAQLSSLSLGMTWWTFCGTVSSCVPDPCDHPVGLPSSK